MNAIQAAEASLGKFLLSRLVDELKIARKPWPAMSEGEQRDAIGRLDGAVRDLVRQAFDECAAAGRTRVRASVESVTLKDGAKIVLKAVSSPEVFELAMHNGPALVVLMDVDALVGGMHEIKPDGDASAQRALPIEDPADAAADDAAETAVETATAAQAAALEPAPGADMDDDDEGPPELESTEPALGEDGAALVIPEADLAGEKCPHGRELGDCAACDVLGDQAHDAAREAAT